MFYRVRVAFGVVLLVTLITATTAFAKGGFSFISITGPDLKEAVRATDLALTNDYFAFADFYQNRTDAPANPGTGYEVTRYYVVNSREEAFDRLHYYPETGFVFYDGLVNGSSEYDGKWYSARPEIKTAFEAVLPGAIQPAASSKPAQPSPSSTQIQPVTLVTLAAGLLALIVLAFRVRRPVTR
jgi:hypothetical protein